MPFYRIVCVECDVVIRQWTRTYYYGSNNSDFKRKYWTFCRVFRIKSSYTFQNINNNTINDRQKKNKTILSKSKNCRVTYVVVWTPGCNPLGSIFMLKLRAMYINSKYLGTLTHGASLVKHKLIWKLTFFSASKKQNK